MTQPICATLSGALSGVTKQGSLTPVTLAYVLDAQTGSQQLCPQVDAGETKVFTLSINLGGPVAAPDEQTLFVLACDVANVDITLNSLGTPVGPFNFKKASGVLVIPGEIGGLPVSDISVVNNGTQRATISITAIYGS
jgi:hypothetical protein